MTPYKRDVLCYLSPMQGVTGDVSIGKCEVCSQTIYDANDTASGVVLKIKK